MSDKIIDDIQTIQIIYTVYKSDEKFLNSVFDSEIYELDIIYDKFFEIILNIRETNILKTSYLLEKLLTTCENNLNIFLKRYPKIKNMFLKSDPNSGFEYLEF